MCCSLKTVSASLLFFLLLTFAVFSKVNLTDNTLVYTEKTGVIVYNPAPDYQIEEFHKLKNNDFCIIGGFYPAKYKKLDIIHPEPSTSSFINLFSSQEFYLPEIKFLKNRIEISHQIPLENYSYSDSPIRITSIIKYTSGKYVKKTGKLHVKDNPVYLYYFAKLQFKKLKLDKSFRYFNLFYKQLKLNSPIREETIYYLCRISSFLNKKDFVKYFQLLKKEYPSSPYIDVFENEKVVPLIEKNIFLGTQYYLSGNFVKSLTHTLEASKLSQELERNEYLPKIYYKLALLYEKNGKKVQAKKMFMEVIHLKLESIYVQFAREKIQELNVHPDR